MAVRLSSITNSKNKSRDKGVSLADITRANIRCVVENVVNSVMNAHIEDVLRYEKEMGRFFMRVKNGDGTRDFKMCVESVRETGEGKWEVRLREVQMWSAFTASKCADFRFNTVRKMNCAVAMWEMLEEVKRGCGGDAVADVKIVQQEDNGEWDFNSRVKPGVRDWWDNLDREQAEGVKKGLKTLGEKIEVDDEDEDSGKYKYRVREHKAVVKVMLPFCWCGSDSGYGYGDDRAAGMEKLRKAVELLGKYEGMPEQKTLELTCMPGVWEDGFVIDKDQMKRKESVEETEKKKLTVVAEALDMFRETGMKFSEVNLRQAEMSLPAGSEVEFWKMLRDKFKDVADESGAMLRWDKNVLDAWAEMNGRVMPKDLEYFGCAVKWDDGEVSDGGAVGRMLNVMYLSKSDEYWMMYGKSEYGMPAKMQQMLRDVMSPCVKLEDFADAVAAPDARKGRRIVVDRKDIRDIRSL